jgi:hypothetical protein
MKKVYERPCVKVFQLKQQSALLQCSSSDGDKTACGVIEVGLSVLDKPGR